jgi:predicted GIY-YIG superfamily endonuclease
LIFTNAALTKMELVEILNNSDMFTGENLTAKSIIHGRGIYLLYTSDDKLLYVGKSENIKNRIRTHLGGKDVATGKFVKFVSKIRVIYVDWDVHRQNLFRVERWIIGNLKPAFNGPLHESWGDSYESFYGRLKETSDDLVGALINEWGSE